ncbi:IhfB1: integration host factor, subunit beta [Desulfosarcina variabilis str. Montpellier]|uniref:HU family DNA-binding protein n=1 Tax=Desulfosarcina variabilis TaxID=2300 RepID=UPI003AFA51BA
MNKLELIDKLRMSTSIAKPQAKKVVDVFFNSMTNALAEGERVEIRGLCTFFPKSYPSYVGRNPKTGQRVTIKPKKLPFFKSGKALRDRINEE